ncbi:facilitated trehalose transporter Tret1-like isoform X1 [Aphis craccivora]|uniref:Facilitated trehalose transporter Tret1-like isoform X1 n=1 Tax=Aphis craccivora TaxID=307492 RepID=A0A6G0Y299_APHCR|nr:facilitated trehalose transporter Tret1-like isoform X1 [Aphis craccivora]
MKLTTGYIAVILLFPCVISGAVLGITGVSEWNLPLTYANSTWFASLAALGAAVGCLISKSLIDEFGPRGSVLLSHVVCATGWILTFSSSITTYLLVGRALTGVFVGIVTVAATTHSTECFPFRPAARPIVFNAVGVLCVYLAGLWLNYGQTAAVATVVTIVSFVLFWSFVPESPAWEPRDAVYSRLKFRVTRLSDGARMLKGVHSTGYGSTVDEAVFQNLHHPDDRSAADETVYQHLHYSDDRSAVDETVYQNIRQSDDKSPVQYAFNELLDLYRPTITRSMRLALQQMSGPLVLVTYAVKLVNDSGVRVLNGQYVAAVLAAFLVVGAFVSTGITRRASASKLAAAGTLIAVIVIAVYNYVRQYGSQLLQNLVPLLCLIVFSMSISVGPIPRSPVPRKKRVACNKSVSVRTVAIGTMAAENVVGQTVAYSNVTIENVTSSRCVVGEHFALAFGYTVAFAVIKCYPYAQAAVGWWVFIFFGVASALNIVYGVLMFSKPKSSNQSSNEPAV